MFWIPHSELSFSGQSFPGYLLVRAGLRVLVFRATRLALTFFYFYEKLYVSVLRS